jgi:hypothetical protein
MYSIGNLIYHQMDSALPANPGSTSFFMFIALFAAMMTGIVVYMIILRNKTVASGNWSEGFQGPSRGVSDIQCGQESSFAIQLSELFATKKSSTEEGEADLREFKLIVSKLCCLKHDLMSTNQVVQATLYLPYNNTHDRENPADTVGRCFTKSLPPRDMEIAFETWVDRALFLLERLCTSYNLTQDEEKNAKENFLSVWSDSYDIAKEVCIAPAPPPITANGSPRDPKGFVPETVKELGPYSGYY